jgi:hypothetical protein
MKYRLAALGALAAIGIGYAVAQVLPPTPTVTNVGPLDLFLDVVNGAPTAVSQYATAKQINGVEGYQYVVPVTAFSIQALNSTSLLFLNPAGTLATGTVLFATSPGDGQKFCIESTQIQTALTVTAGTGQTISSLAIGAVTALTAGTPVCWFYDAPLATWFRRT